MAFLYFFLAVFACFMSYVAIVCLLSRFQVFSKKYLLRKIVSKSCPMRVPRSGDDGRSIDCFSTYLAHADGQPFCMVQSLQNDEIGCLEWDGEKYSSSIKVDLSTLTNDRFEILHHFGLSDVKYFGLQDFSFHYFTRMVYLRIRFYRAIKSVDQYFFNKKNVVNIDRAQVLSCIHDMYLDGSGVGFSESSLLTRIHKYKWVRHPDKQLLLAKIKLHIKSLVEGGELNVIRGGQYSVNGKLLTTITMEEKNEREFVAAVKHQRMILFLTLVLVFVGAIQAGIIKLPVLIDFG